MERRLRLHPNVHPNAVPWLLGLTVVAGGVASGLVLGGSSGWAGLAMAGGAAVLLLAGSGARDSKSPRLIFADRIVERLLDAMVLGVVAWVATPHAPWRAAAALTLLLASYMASYVRARAEGLGFRVEPHFPYRPVRLALITGSLLLDDSAGIGLWLAAAIALDPIVRTTSTVARQREPE